MDNLSGKVAVITGGARGIGRSIAEKLFREGARVVICSRNKKELKKTCQEIDPAGKKFLGFSADVSKFNDCKKLIDFTLRIFGKVDILVNNAGVYGPIGKLETNELKEWKHSLEINLLGAVNCCKLVIPLMKKKKKGKIINLAGAGVGGNNPLPNFTLYFTSKMAIVGFAETLASELAESNIQVNCISPGAVYTHLTDFLISQGPKKSGEKMFEDAKKQKSGQATSPELAASLVAFLCSDKANHITGRLLSAKWDTPELLEKLKPENKNLFRLRRIDNQLFHEKKS